MRRSRARIAAASSAALPVLALLVSPVASAAPKPGDTEALVAALSADAAHASVVKGPLDRARSALDRAKGMDRAGDTVHGNILRAVAAEWAEVARDTVRAADAETRAAEAEKALDDLQTKTIRGRALIEETAARRGRAQALLQQLEAERAAPKQPAQKPQAEPAKTKPPKAAGSAPRGDE
ncbi:MAG TPA: hypothetical protein VHE30_07475 [Polyangiaceae bacterium]|nr:hypothetical protein [Polyangiaceae bacterium]